MLRHRSIQCAEISAQKKRRLSVARQRIALSTNRKNVQRQASISASARDVTAIHAPAAIPNARALKKEADIQKHNN